jgi:hypothetical protein
MLEKMGQLIIVFECKRHGKVGAQIVVYNLPFTKYICKQCDDEGMETSITLKGREN